MYNRKNIEAVSAPTPGNIAYDESGVTITFVDANRAAGVDNIDIRNIPALSVGYLEQ